MVDTVAETVDTAVDDSVEAPDHWALWVDFRLVHFQEGLEVVASEAALAVT